MRTENYRVDLAVWKSLVTLTKAVFEVKSMIGMYSRKSGKNRISGNEHRQGFKQFFFQEKWGCNQGRRGSTENFL